MGAVQEDADQELIPNERAPDSHPNSKALTTGKIVETIVKNENGDVCKLRKIQVSPDSLKENTEAFRCIVNSVQNLMYHNTPSLIRYDKVWFEGPLSEQCYTIVDCITDDTKVERIDKPIEQEKQSAQENTELTEGTSVPNLLAGEDSTFLCIITEYYNYQTLDEWLRNCEGSRLFESQIIYVIWQLVSALSIFVEKGITIRQCELTRDIHVLENAQFAHDSLPSIKLTNPDFEALLLVNSLELTCSIRPENILKCIADLFTKLLENNLETCTESAKQLTTFYPNELEIIQEMNQTTEISETTLSVVLSKLEMLKDNYLDAVMMNVPQPIKYYTGREEEIAYLVEVLTSEVDPDKNMICIEGPVGIGKSALASEVLWRILTVNKSYVWCILQLNASSTDNLTRSLFGLIATQKFPISLKDHTGNFRLLKDIFHELLTSLSEKRLLVIFEDADVLTEELAEMIKIFKDNAKSFEPSPKHYIILTRREPWENNPVLGKCVCVKVTNLGISESENLVHKLLDHPPVPPPLDVKALVELSCCTPASLRLITSYLKYNSAADVSNRSAVIYLENCKNVLQDIANLFEKCITSNTMKPDKPFHMPYALALIKLHESSNEQTRQLIMDVLGILNNADIVGGLPVVILRHILSQCPSGPINEASINKVLNSFHQLSLIEIKNKTVYMSYWMQQSLTESIQLLSQDNQCPCLGSLLQTIKTILTTSLSSSSSNNHSTFPCWNILPHACAAWIKLTRNNHSLAKEFDTFPELVAKTAQHYNKFDEITGYLKLAVETLAAAHENPYDFHVLSLKFILAEGSLLPKSKVNEAFMVLKMIQERSRAEPREFLMLKLKSLIELGQIHITRQEYEKSISCFQQVQVFAVQKISLLELDSEPVVLKSRMMHGYAYLLLNNPGEAKKILLHVIPLLEKYSGLELSQVRMLAIQAKFFLATLLRKTGDLVNALMMQTKVLDERERILGCKHPDTWASKQEMAMLFSAYDNHEKALILLREVLEVQEEVLGAPSNRQSLATMNAIAEVEAKLGNFDDALELYEAIDLIEQQVLPENDEMRISSQLNQADVLIALGQYKESIDILDLIYALRSSSEHNSYNLELCKNILSKREKAEKSMEILGNYWLELTPENMDNPSALQTLSKKHEMAMELSENQDNHGALRFLREILEDGSYLEDTNKFHLNVKADLARVLGLVGKFNESFSVYKEIIPLMDTTFGETDELTMLCKDTMGQVFLFSGNQFLKRQMSNLKWFLL